MTIAVQHTCKFRIDKKIVDVACPPFVSVAFLEAWLAEVRIVHPDWQLVSRSWSPNAAA